MFKRIVGILLFSIISCCFCFSYSKPEIYPDWVIDVQAVYPLENYFAQLGEGKTEAMAKNNAVSKISSYLESNVETVIKSSQTMSHGADKVDKSQSVNISTTVTSDVTLFAVEYTDAFYSKREKKYYVVAYILRETVWKQYVPTIEDAKNIFYGHIENAEKEKDPFFKISYYQEALKSSEDFLLKLYYGRVISPKREEAQFSKDRDFISSIPATISEIKRNISFNINVKNDYLNSVSAGLKAEILDLGYKTKTTNDASYQLVAEIDYNQTKDDDLIVLNPVLKLHIYNSVRDFMNMEIVSDEVIAATVDYAKQFAMQDMLEKLHTDFRNRMEKVYDK